jgi:hypothetical protein
MHIVLQPVLFTGAMHTVLFLQPFLLCWFRVTTSVAASLTQPSALSCWLQKGGFLFGIPCISFRAAAHGVRSSFAARRDQRRCPLQVLGFFLPGVLDRSRCCVPGGRGVEGRFKLWDLILTEPPRPLRTAPREFLFYWHRDHGTVHVPSRTRFWTHM